PTEEHATVAQIAKRDVPELEPELPNNPRDFKTPNYGMRTWGDLFTPRQLTALTTFSDLIAQAREKVLEDARRAPAFVDHSDPAKPLSDGGTGPVAYADAVATYLAFAVDKASDYWSSICTWHSSG